MKLKAKEHGLFLLGIAICFGVAGLSVWVETLIPGELLGASIIALFMGTIINGFFQVEFGSKNTKKALHIHICVL